jgi:hypothetical protein
LVFSDEFLGVPVLAPRSWTSSPNPVFIIGLECCQFYLMLKGA